MLEYKEGEGVIMVKTHETFEPVNGNRKTISPEDKFNRIQDGLKRPFFSKEVSEDIDLEDKIEKLKSLTNQPNRSVELVISGVIGELGFIDESDEQTAEAERLSMTKLVKTTYERYTKQYWRNFYIRDRLDLDKLQRLHNHTEGDEDNRGLLYVVRVLNQRTSDSDSGKKNILMDSERVVRLLLLDEAKILAKQNL